MDSFMVLITIAGVALILYLCITEYQKWQAERDKAVRDSQRQWSSMENDRYARRHRRATEHRIEAEPDWEDEIPKQTWDKLKWPLRHDLRPEGYVVLPGCANVSVKGVNLRVNEGKEFALEAELDPAPILRVVANPKDSDHPEGYAVIANAGRGFPNRRIGYLPKDMALKIRAEFRADLPLSAEIRSLGTHLQKGSIFIKINVLAPKAKERNKFKIADT
ncbi:hypothetical protein [Shimia sp.]|uniref:hypothetical protein n=1 Tax=Shimia sp. TaxID=1954381 RepID=UPI003BA9FFC6